MHLRSRQVQKAIHSLRQSGYAVVVRKPKEQGNFDRREIEQAMHDKADTLVEFDASAGDKHHDHAT